MEGPRLLIPTPGADETAADHATGSMAQPNPTIEPQPAPDDEPPLPRILPANAERSAVRRDRESASAVRPENASEQISPAGQLDEPVLDPFRNVPSGVTPASGVEPLPNDSLRRDNGLEGAPNDRVPNESGPNHSDPNAIELDRQPTDFDRGALMDRAAPLDRSGPAQRNELTGRDGAPRNVYSNDIPGSGLDEPRPIQRATGDGTNSHLPPAANDSGALVPVQPGIRPVEPTYRGVTPAGGISAAGATQTTGPATTTPPQRSAPGTAAAAAAHPPGTITAEPLAAEPVPAEPAPSTTAQRLVMELFAFGSVDARGESASASGSSPAAAGALALKDVLQRTSQPSERLNLIQAYWQMATMAAQHQSQGQYIAILEQLVDAYRAEPSGIPAELKAAMATAKARQQETLVAWAEASSRLGVPATGAPALYRPADLPHAGSYRTEYEHLFADRVAPPRVALLNQLLPYRHEAVQRRADAMMAAGDQAVAADEAFRRGELSLSRFLAAIRREMEEQLRFLQDVETYNNEIAEYAISATGGQLPIATLAETLVKDPQGARQPAASSAAPMSISPSSIPPSSMSPRSLPSGSVPGTLPPGTAPSNAFPPGTLGPQPAIPATPQPLRGTVPPGSVPPSRQPGGIPTEALPPPGGSPSATSSSQLTPGAALPASPNGVMPASGNINTNELPGRSILKATSTLPARDARANPQGAIGATDPPLRPIPQTVRPMSASPTTVPAGPRYQPQRPTPQPTPAQGWTAGPASSTDSGSAIRPSNLPQNTPSQGLPRSEPSRENAAPEPSSPANPSQPVTPADAAPLDRMTLKPVDYGHDPLAELARWAGADPSQCAVGIRDTFFRSLPVNAREQPLEGAALSGSAAASRWWNFIQQLADQRSLHHYLAQLASLEQAAMQRQQRGAGDYALLAVRATLYSAEADLATAQANESVARTMLREVLTAELERLPRLPAVPSDVSGDPANSAPSPWQRWQARHVEAAAVAVAANAAAVQQLRSQWLDANRPVEYVLDALATSRQAHQIWLAAVTRYQKRDELY